MLYHVFRIPLVGRRFHWSPGSFGRATVSVSTGHQTMPAVETLVMGKS